MDDRYFAIQQRVVDEAIQTKKEEVEVRRKEADAKIEEVLVRREEARARIEEARAKVEDAKARQAEMATMRLIQEDVVARREGAQDIRKELSAFQEMVAEDRKAEAESRNAMMATLLKLSSILEK
ncbi:hypothetical protein BGX21_007920, partial [Mortierella sp. AD011]